MSMGILVAAPETRFNKTSKGREILRDRQAGLQLKHRQVLILLDGARSIGAIAAMLAGQDLGNIIRDLHADGLIEQVTQTRTTSANNPRQEIATPAPLLKSEQAKENMLDPLALTRAKLIMQESARQYLGLMADKLQHEVAMVQTYTQMRSALAHWNMALRESPKGSAKAGELMVEVKTILNWGSIS